MDLTSQGYELYANKNILAPMVRAGRTPLRMLCLDYGADVCYTDEIIDQKMLTTRRVVNNVLGTVDYIGKDDRLDVVMRVTEAEKSRCVLQIGTSSGEGAASVAKLVGTDVAAIDVNMGCPKSFSVHAGMGAALLKQTDKVKEILTSLKAAAQVPISCKIRVLDDPSMTLNLVREIEKCGVSAIGVHGRRRDERNPDKVRLDEIREVARTVTVPIIANGLSDEIREYSDISVYREKCGASSVMLARRALSNPSVFRKQGLLTMEEDIGNFLDKVCEFDEEYMRTKYVLARMLGSEQHTHPQGPSTLSAISVLEICRIWNKEEKYEQEKRERKRKGAKRKAEAEDNEFDEHGVRLIDVCFPMKKLKAVSNCTPKTVLNEYIKEMRGSKPLYTVIQNKENKRYEAIIEVFGKKFRSRIPQISVKMAEQVAALAALIGLNIRHRLPGEWEEE